MSTIYGILVGLWVRMFVHANGSSAEGTSITNHIVVSGTLIDFLGVKISLIIGFGILLVSRCVSPFHHHALPLLLSWCTLNTRAGSR